MSAKFDPALLAELTAGEKLQAPASEGYSPSSDPNYPVFTTPTGKTVLVYIPMLNVRKTEAGDVHDLQTIFFHSVQQGKFSRLRRCVAGLQGGAFESHLHYDGGCPYCDVTGECWDLYNLKLKEKATAMGINWNPGDEVPEILAPNKGPLAKERAVSQRDEYVVFPIVLIPVVEGTFTPTNDFVNHLQPQFAVWTKKRYEKNLLRAMDNLMTGNPGHPCGRFWLWNFTGGGNLNLSSNTAARDAAKDATYTRIDQPDFINLMEPYRQQLEAVASQFTHQKANEVVRNCAFMTHEEIIADVNKAMGPTRQRLSLYNVQNALPGATAPGAGAAPAALPAVDGAFASFAAQQSQAQPQSAAPNMGFGAPAQPAAPVAPMGQPAPAVPQMPMGQPAPVAPIQPAAPVQPAMGQPAAPVAPAQPAAPVMPNVGFGGLTGFGT